MADAFIQVPPDSTGSKVRTTTAVISAQTVHIHWMIPCDSSGAEYDNSNPSHTLIYGARVGGGYNDARIETNPTSGEDGLLVNVMPYSDPLWVEGQLTNGSAAPSTNNVGVLGALSGSARQNYASGRLVLPWTDLFGRLVVQPGGAVGEEFHETAQYTSTQTGTAFVTPNSGKKLVVTHYQIQVGGTTAGTMQLWYGASGDTTYSRGTDRAIFDGEFAPSATLKPGVMQTKESGWPAAAADDILRVTTSAAINPITITVWYYEV